MNFSRHSALSLFYMFLCALFISCAGTRSLKKSVEKDTDNTSFFKGFVLYDPIEKEVLINHNGSRYFTPASNTKLFTFYSAYKLLKDSIKALEFAEINDSLFIKGTADPSFLYGFDSTRVTGFLKQEHKAIFLVDTAIADPVLGSGWSWDDYPYYYMPEKSIFPIYGNLVNYSSRGDSLVSSPSYFKEAIHIQDSVLMRRKQSANLFYLKQGDTLLKTAPFKTSNALTAQLLSDFIGKGISLVDAPQDLEFKSFYATPKDSLLKEMLVVSDNFIAEQLLLQVGKEVSGHYSVDSAIAHTLKYHLHDLPQEPRWVDGSGLSRYNLFTPESNVALLEKMLREIPRNKLLNYFAVGGKTGTLKNWYGNADRPYIFAKSGTLSNNYNLSGYLITEKGRLLIFSSMNNHFRIPLREVKTEIEMLLLAIYKNY